jgi:uncharacterized membrane protein
MSELPRPRAVNTLRRRLVWWMRQGILWLSRHWLAVLNTFWGLFVGLAFAAPILATTGYQGLAHLLYVAYSLTCHQLPSRSYFMGGQQVAICQRDVAIYATLLGSGLIFSLIRRRLQPMTLRWYVFWLVPIALDGGMSMASEWLPVTPMTMLWAMGLMALGLTSAILRRQKYLTWHSYLFFAFGPLALIYLQFFGPYESNEYMRTLTGFIFGVGTIWYVYPQFEAGFKGVRARITTKLAQALS